MTILISENLETFNNSVIRCDNEKNKKKSVSFTDITMIFLFRNKM